MYSISCCYNFMCILNAWNDTSIARNNAIEYMFIKTFWIYK